MLKYNPGQKRAIEQVLTAGVRYGLLYGGARSGKTMLLCDSIDNRALYAPGSRHLIVRRTAVAAKQSVALDTFRKMMTLKYGMSIERWNSQDGYFSYDNGSEVWIGGLDDESAMEKVLGKEYCTIYTNEASEIPYQGFVLLRTRLAQVVRTMEGDTLSQRFYVDLNPTSRAHWTYRLFVDGFDPDSETPVNRKEYAWAKVNPIDNEENLTRETLADLAALPARERRRFYEGEYTGDAPNALWRREWFRRISRTASGALPFEPVRIVVGVDPAASNTQYSDETGIVVCATDKRGTAYVLADESGRWSPEEWSSKVVAAYRQWNADRVVAETNNGGDMVEHVLRVKAPNLPFRKVTATRGKVVRAEPVAALYELQKVCHLGELTELEDQMCAVTSQFDPKTAGFSPDRVDALVWAMTELFPEVTRRNPATTWKPRRVGSHMAC